MEWKIPSKTGENGAVSHIGGINNMRKFIISIFFIITLVSVALCSFTIYENKKISDNIISDILYEIPLLIESLESDYINDSDVKNLFSEKERLYYFSSDVHLESIIEKLSFYENLNKKSYFYLNQLTDDLKITLQAIRNGRSYENGVEILKEIKDILKLYSNRDLPFKKTDLQVKEKFYGGELHNRILEYSHSGMTFNYKNGDILFHEKSTFENELPYTKKTVALSDVEMNLFLHSN